MLRFLFPALLVLTACGKTPPRAWRIAAANDASTLDANAARDATVFDAGPADTGVIDAAPIGDAGTTCRFSNQTFQMRAVPGTPEFVQGEMILTGLDPLIMEFFDGQVAIIGHNAQVLPNEIFLGQVFLGVVIRDPSDPDALLVGVLSSDGSDDVDPVFIGLQGPLEFIMPNPEDPVIGFYDETCDASAITDCNTGIPQRFVFNVVGASADLPADTFRDDIGVYAAHNALSFRVPGQPCPNTPVSHVEAFIIRRR